MSWATQVGTGQTHKILCLQNVKTVFTNFCYFSLEGGEIVLSKVEWFVDIMKNYEKLWGHNSGPNLPSPNISVQEYCLV